MQFGTGPDAAGPFYLSREELEQQHHPHGEIVKKLKTRDDLKNDFKQVGIGFKNSKKKVHLVELAQAAHIPLKKEVYEKQGWEGAPKGGLQLAAESGFIDPNELLFKYAMEPKKEWLDDDGNIKDEFKKYYLHPLLDQRMDFKNAKTELEDLAELLMQTSGGTKCTVFFTPKYHCRIASLGIEYSWGLEKKYYCQKISLKWKKNDFLGCVEEAQSQITKQNVRNFNALIHRCMVTYRNFDSGDGDEMMYKEIKKFVRKYKNHRGAEDQDAAFLNRLVKEMFGMDG